MAGGNGDGGIQLRGRWRRFLFGWGMAGGGDGGAAPASNGNGLKICVVTRLVSFNNSAFFYYISLILLFTFGHIIRFRYYSTY
jgi:hypothetical protein